MKRSSAVLLPVLLALAGPPALAAEPPSLFEARCERELRPVLQVRAAPTDYQVDNSVPSRLLRNRGARVYAGELMLGMTSTQQVSTIDFDAPSLTDKESGRECISPQISVTLVFQPINVYVAREFTPHSCPYRTVLQHEMRHVRVYEEQIPRLTAYVKAKLEERYGNRPLYAKAGEGINQLQADVDNWLRPMIQYQLGEVEKMQLALDTQEEKTMMSASCLGQVADNLGAVF